MVSYDNSAIKVIGITGFKQTGKSTLATEIQNVATNKGLITSRYAFAKPLKEVCHILFGGNEANWYGDFKTQELPFWVGKIGIKPTPRTIMQFVGTEMFRDTLSRSFWTHVAERYINDIYEEEHFDVLIVDDVRFDNEAYFLQDSYETHIVKLYRDLPDPVGGHASEMGISQQYIDMCFPCDDRDSYKAIAERVLKEVL